MSTIYSERHTEYYREATYKSWSRMSRPGPWRWNSSLSPSWLPGPAGRHRHLGPGALRQHREGQHRERGRPRLVPVALLRRALLRRRADLLAGAERRRHRRRHPGGPALIVSASTTPRARTSPTAASPDSPRPGTTYSGYGRNAITDFTPPGRSDYFVEVAGSGGSTGTYTLSVTDITDTSTSLPVDDWDGEGFAHFFGFIFADGADDLFSSVAQASKREKRVSDGSVRAQVTAIDQLK